MNQTEELPVNECVDAEQLLSNPLDAKSRRDLRATHRSNVIPGLGNGIYAWVFFTTISSFRCS